MNDPQSLGSISSVSRGSGVSPELLTSQEENKQFTASRGHGVKSKGSRVSGENVVPLTVQHREDSGRLDKPPWLQQQGGAQPSQGKARRNEKQVR